VEFSIFNLMGSRDPAKPTAEVFAEVAEQTRRADELGYAIAWFTEHHLELLPVRFAVDDGRALRPDDRRGQAARRARAWPFRPPSGGVNE
jgi:alkanesulfonate monooxygenase SsuD/methylene tetrahydromethanopterin reductase-like flavin-dependent oxidoreductase (luciferase family)